MVESFQVVLKEFGKRYGIRDEEKHFDDLMQLSIELPNHLVGIFNDLPRVVPKGTFLNSAQQMLRSRTLSMFSSGISSNFRSSVPDLSRSVPNTPLFFKQDRPRVTDLQDGTSSMPRPRPSSKSDMNRHNKMNYSNNTSPKFVEFRKFPQVVNETFHEEDVVEIKTSPTPSTINTIKEENNPPLTTFRSSFSPSTVALREHNDDMVVNRFGRKTMSSNEELRNIRVDPHSLLHPSSSFVIKRPSVLPERSMSMTASHSLHNIPEGYPAKRRQQIPNDAHLAGEKAAALLDEVDPQLRATLRRSETYEEDKLYEGFLLQRGPKFTLPRIVPNATEKPNTKDADSVA